MGQLIEKYAPELGGRDALAPDEADLQVQRSAGALFREFGKDAYPELALLLTHELEFVQVGAYSILNAAMNAHGLKRHVRQSDRERMEIRNQFLAILASEGE